VSLHQQLLDLIGEYRTSADADDYPVRLPLDALRAVVELHAPYLAIDGQPYACQRCGVIAGWPCDHIEAVARELGIEATDHGQG
jgi:hypothetical protein